MEQKENKVVLLGSIMSWFAIVMQLILIIQNRVASILETVIRFFSFFTILTNILVALCFTSLWLKPKFKIGTFFINPKTITASAVYITIVGIVYNVILRFIWAPVGLQKLVDELLHLIIPIFFVTYWYIFVSKNTLVWKNIATWLLYPIIYLIYSLVRGNFTNYYPYPFIDVDKLGSNAVAFNCISLLIVFVIISLLFILIAKRKIKAKVY